MRHLLLFITFCALAATAWFAVRHGSDLERLRGAPQIERIVAQGVHAAIDGLTASTVDVQVDGRNVVLSGSVEDAATREAILVAASETRLLGELEDRLVVVPTVSPFTFDVVKAADGSLALSGYVPSASVEDDVLGLARAIESGAPIRSDLTVAGGVPAGDWVGVVSAGLRAVGNLQAGRFALSDMSALLVGTAPTPKIAATIDEIAATASDADWTIDLVGLLPLADPFTFTTLKTADGAIVVGGHAPDEMTRKLMLSWAQSLSAQPVDGELVLAGGMPETQWPDLVRRALAGLNAAESGFLSIQNDGVSLTLGVATEDDREQVVALLDPAWSVEIDVSNPSPQSALQIRLTEDGKLAADGVIPADAEVTDILAALPGLEAGTLAAGGQGRMSDWEPAFEALRIVLPRLQSGQAVIGRNALALSGDLKRGFSAEGSEAAVRAAMPAGWDVALDLTESAPLAEAMLSVVGGEVALTGLLPAGLAPQAALDALGPAASGEGLATGGDGDGQQWGMAMQALGEGLDLFTGLTGRISDQSVSLDGVLRPGYRPNDVQDWLSARVPEGWSLGLAAQETPANEGDARSDLRTGEREVYRSGHWLPDLDFSVSAERCGSEARSAMARQLLTFVPGSARIDTEGRGVLDRLAAIAIRCVNSSPLRLRIAGHTDAVGNDDSNQRLSETRAEAVMKALVDRGVDPASMIAEGFGEAQPIATNDTPEGRAQNRRIEFGFAEGSE